LLDKGTDVTGHKVWPASMVLGLYLVKNREKFADKTILEVGAGTGKRLNIFLADIFFRALQTSFFFQVCVEYWHQKYLKKQL